MLRGQTRKGVGWTVPVIWNCIKKINNRLEFRLQTVRVKHRIGNTVPNRKIGFREGK